MANDVKSLAHTKWNCKYHIVFAPKYRRKVFFGEKKREIGKILRQLCEWKGVEIIEAEICPDHVHMLVSIPPKVAVSSFMGYLKGKSSLMIYEQFGDMKFKYRNREFWCRGYYVDTVGKDKKKIAEYIKHQIDEDRLGEQMTMLGKDYEPFKSEKKRQEPKSKNPLAGGKQQLHVPRKTRLRVTSNPSPRRCQAVYAPARALLVF